MNDAMQVPMSRDNSPQSVSSRQIWLPVGLAIALAIMLVIDWQLWDSDLMRRTIWSKEFVVFALVGAAVASAVLAVVAAKRLPAIVGVPIIFILLTTIPIWLYSALMVWIWWGFSIAG
jgi:hypothetical protein